MSFDYSNSIGVTTTIPTSVDYNVNPIASNDIYHTVTVVDGLIRQGVLNSASVENCEGYVDLSGIEADAIDWPLNVGSTELVYNPGGGILVQLGVFGWGSYAFDEATQNISRPAVRDGVEQINHQSFRISEYGPTTAEGADQARELPLRFVPWETFEQNGYDIGANAPGKPIYVTQDYEGRYRFYPALNKDCSVS